MDHSVLLVENDRNLRSLMAMLLARAGYRVIAASTVPAALRLLRLTSAELLIADPGEPRTDLSAFSLPCNGQPGVGGLPTIIVSSYGEAECRATLQGLNIVGFVPKPFRNRELVAAVSRVLH